MATRSKRSVKSPQSAAAGKAEKAPAPAKKGGAKAAKPRARAGGKGTALVIVESPTKAKTIGKYLGSGYDVRATVGHLRDLPTRELGVDVERDFEPKYVTIKGKTKTLSELKKAAKTASTIYLATDPDREGEAIAWHVADQLDSKAPTHRVLFHEITKDAIHEAMANPGQIDDRKVNAQQARRDPRPAGGLQGEPDPLAEHQDRPLRRAGADRGPPAHRRARARDPRVHAPGVLEHRGALRQGRPDLRGVARQDRRPQAAAPLGRGRAGRGGRGATAAVRGHQGREAEPPEESRRAVHHQHAAAGGRQEARLRLPAHDARGAGSLRGHGRRRGRPGRSHHLHADRLACGCPTRPSPRCATSSDELQEALPARRAEHVQLPEERPGAGRPRGHSADRRAPPARAGQRTSSPTSSGSTSSSGSGSSPRR